MFLIAGNLELLWRFFNHVPLFLSKDKLFADATVFAVLTWFGGILLLVCNLGILQFFEGYGRLNPMRACRRLQVRRFKKLQREMDELDAELDCCTEGGQEFPSTSRLRRNRLIRYAAERFPDQESSVLPTSIGNAMRAFEVYPRVMYGLEGIQGWTRLIAVIPKEYSKLLDEAKTQVDLCANACLIGVLLGLEYVFLTVYYRRFIEVWFPVIALGLAVLAFELCRDATIQWGELVKSSFDVFRGDLQRKLGFSAPVTKSEERELWTAFSQAINFRMPDVMPEKHKRPVSTHRTSRDM